MKLYLLILKTINITLKHISMISHLTMGKLLAIYKVDNEHNGELVAVTDNLSFELELYSMVLIKEK